MSGTTAGVADFGMSTYTFGDDLPAVERLALVASAYEPVSTRLLDDWGTRDAGLALDLGCGPGFSTQLLARLLMPRKLIGVDQSPEFLEVARARVPDAEFQARDITTGALSRTPADLVYARLVLAHLPDPLATAMRWCEGLGPDGTLLIEDLEAVEAPPGPLQTYERVSATIVQQGGGLMYAGQALAPLGGRCLAVTVPAALAAAIYLLNVRRWLHEAPAAVSDAELADLETALTATAHADAGTVSWIVRQIAVRA